VKKKKQTTATVLLFSSNQRITKNTRFYMK